MENKKLIEKCRENRELGIAKLAWKCFLLAHGDECDLDAVLDTIIDSTLEIAIPLISAEAEKKWLIELLEAGIQVSGIRDIIIVLKATEAEARKQEREGIMGMTRIENYRDVKTIEGISPGTKEIVPTHWKTGHLITEEDWQALKESKEATKDGR